MESVAVQIIRFADIDPSPWRNGGGITWEVAAQPGEGGHFDWRISIAEVARAGPFSAYPDVDRVITLITGAAMDLMVAGEPLRLVPLEPYAFAGEVEVDATLPSGTTRDLNVMTRRGRVHATVRVHRDGEAWTTADDGVQRFLVCVGEPADITAAGKSVRLQRYDSLRVSQAVQVGAADVVEIEII